MIEIRKQNKRKKKVKTFEILLTADPVFQTKGQFCWIYQYLKILEGSLLPRQYISVEDTSRFCRDRLIIKFWNVSRGLPNQKMKNGELLWFYFFMLCNFSRSVQFQILKCGSNPSFSLIQVFLEKAPLFNFWVTSAGHEELVDTLCWSSLKLFQFFMQFSNSFKLC